MNFSLNNFVFFLSLGIFCVRRVTSYPCNVYQVADMGRKKRELGGDSPQPMSFAKENKLIFMYYDVTFQDREQNNSGTFRTKSII